MKLYIFIASLMGVGFLLGYVNVWEKWNDHRKEIEDAPYSHDFTRLQWSINALEQRNEQEELDRFILDISEQIEAQNEFFRQQREHRLNENDSIMVYSRIILVSLILIASFTRPKQKTQPVVSDNA